MSPRNLRATAIRETIQDFLIGRRDDKLEKLKENDEKRAEIHAQFEASVWLEDAARRVVQIQAVTHSLKPIHPDAKGSNLFRSPTSLAPIPFVGTHCLGELFDIDVVGNAAALDVYKFLKLSNEGQRFLDLAVKGDFDFIAALSDDAALGQQWAAAFSGLATGPDKVSSHTYAKQLYWLLAGEEHSALSDSSYHLLAPLYPTSLIHRVYQQLQNDRFSEEAKAARAARKDGTHHDHPVREYPNLAIQNLGGTKPQNISQLNSERRGDNYLLASVPPIWKSASIRPIWGVNSLFKSWGRRPNVSLQVRALRQFLEKNPVANLETRQRVQNGVEALIDELIQFQAELLTLVPGWSQSDDCNLPTAHRIWLDREGQEPNITTEDTEASISADFARWLNAQLRNPLPIGDNEFEVWRKLAFKQLQELAREAT